MINNWKDMPDGREKYQAYLCSPNWAWRRGAIKERCDGVCEKCRTHPMEHVHHLTYIRKYREELTDLIGICESCHSKEHAIRDAEPQTPNPAEKRSWIMARIRSLSPDDRSPRRRSLLRIAHIRARERVRMFNDGKRMIELYE